MTSRTNKAITASMAMVMIALVIAIPLNADDTEAESREVYLPSRWA